MQGAALLDALVALAREAGVEVRPLPRPPGRDGDAPARSGACRVRGAVWLLLAPDEPVEDRIDAVAAALHCYAAAWLELRLEERWLPPAVRERLEGGPGSGRPLGA